jgi:hypothetical protein
VAKTKSWTDLQEPCCTRTFADGDATDWCVHDYAGVYTSVTIENRGTGVLYVSRGPAVRGPWAATHHMARLQPGEKFPMYSRGQTAKPATPEFSTFGADGATHPMGVTFEAA